jgi:hypothetical protein
MLPNSDAWANTVARTLVVALTDRGVTLQVRAGRLRVEPMRLVSVGEVGLLRRHRADLIVIVLACDDRTLDRLLALRSGRLGQVAYSTEGRCHVCADTLPSDRVQGRCGWCSLAVRLHVGAPVPADLLTLFGWEIRGIASTRSPAMLAFDYAVPA